MSKLAKLIKENAGADFFLWRNVWKSAGALGGATAIWILLELVEYHFLTLVSQLLILALVVLFLWSTAAKFIDMRSPQNIIIEVDETRCLLFASSLSYKLNRGVGVLQEVASGQKLMKFLCIIFGLWNLSIIGSWCSFLTLLYISCVLLHTLPILYLKYGHPIDACVDEAMTKFNKVYEVFDAKVLSKIPRKPSTENKRE